LHPISIDRESARGMTPVIPAPLQQGDSPLDGDPSGIAAETIAMAARGNPFKRFHDDHRKVLARLDAIEQTLPRGAARLGAGVIAGLEALVSVLARQFATHSATEERVLFPALAEAFPGARPTLKPLEREHDEMRSMLARLEELLAESATPARDEQIVIQVRDLVDLLRIHIRKEEQSVLNVARRVLTAAEISALGARMADVGRSGVPRAPRKEAS
jgi:hemerythrin-like domain-containing protein